MGLLATSSNVYYTFSEAPLSGNLDSDRKISEYLKRLKESSWFAEYGKNITLEGLSLNINVIELFMFATDPCEALSDKDLAFFKNGFKIRHNKCLYLVCPGILLLMTSLLTSASIGLCYFFTKDAVSINPVKMSLIFSLTALASLTTSWVFMYVISNRRSHQLAELNVKELSLWDHFEHHTVKAAAREWLKLFNPQAQAGESHSKFQNRRSCALLIYEHINPQELCEAYKKLTIHHEKIDQIFSHFKETKTILERQIAYEALNVEMISQDYLHYNLTGSDIGLYAAQLNYFKRISNRWEI